MRRHLLLLFLVTTILARAQDPSTLLPLRSEAPFPIDFFMPTTERVLQAMSRVDDADTISSERRKRFIVKSNFLLDRLLFSGQVLVNDTLSRYLGRVADSLLRDDYALRRELRFCTLRSSESNAWTFDRGVILVTTGLIARLDNEAQLAFVLAHEIAHYKRRHSFNTFVLGDEGGLHGPRRSLYSRDNESEADRDAVEMLSQTRYDLHAASQALEKLHFSYLPIEETVFDKSAFEDSALVFPASYKLTVLNKIDLREDYNDSLSTHPNTRKRRRALEALIAAVPADGRVNELLSPEAFQNVKTLAAFDLCSIYLGNLREADAIYTASALLKKNPDNLYLQRSIAQALAQTAVFRAGLSRHSDDTRFNFSNNLLIQGESQQAYYFLGQLRQYESAVLALHYAWNLHHRFPADASTNEICDSLFALLTSEYLTPADFSTSLPGANSIRAINPEDRGATASSGDSWRYGFAILLRDSSFTSRFTYFVERRRNALVNAARSATTSGKTEKKRQGSMLILPPVYRSVNSNDYSQNEDLLSAAHQLRFERLLQERSAQKKYPCLFLQPGEADEDVYNDCGAMNDWLGERVDLGAVLLSPLSTTAVAREAAKRRGARYLAFFAVTHEQIYNSDGLHLTAESPRRCNPQTSFYVLVFDVENGNLVYDQTTKVKKRDTDKLLQEMIDKALKGIFR